MKYENTKSLTDLIDKIVLSESEELAKSIQNYKKQYEQQIEYRREDKKTMEELRNKNEELSRHIEIIKKYEQDTWKYYKAEPQYEYQWDEFWNWDMWICWIDVIEVTKEQKYPEPTPKQEQQQIESDEMPF